MTASPAAGSWLNEYARRSRHYALWLLFVTQHFNDLANDQGRALLANSVLGCASKTTSTTSSSAATRSASPDTDIEQITTLPQRKGDYSTVYMVIPRGRGAVRVALGDLEYWIAAPTPSTTSPPATRRSSPQTAIPGRRCGYCAPPTGTSAATKPRASSSDASPQPPPRRIAHMSVAVQQRPRSKAIWLLLPAAAFMIMLAPVVLLAGAGNPPCQPTSVSVPTGPATGGMFATPLQLQAGQWYQVGATQYGGPSDPTSGDYGSSGSFLPAYPSSFAELSVLASNPANGGTFTFADANALNNLPYGSAVRVRNGEVERVLYKRDIGYGQGPGQSIPYRIDVWYEAAAPLGISKTPVDIALAPASGTAATLGQLPTTTAATTTPLSTCGGSYTGPLPLTTGQQAKILPDGLAAAPTDAPTAVKLAIAAGNQLIDKPYIWGGGHGTPLSVIASGYDCSGATSYVLYDAGLLGLCAQVAAQLESYGSPDPGSGSPSTPTPSTRSSTSPAS